MTGGKVGTGVGGSAGSGVAVTTMTMGVGVSDGTTAVGVGEGTTGVGVGEGSSTTTVTGGEVGLLGATAFGVGVASRLDKAPPRTIPTQQTKIKAKRPSPPHSSFLLVVIIFLFLTHQLLRMWLASLMLRGLSQPGRFRFAGEGLTGQRQAQSSAG